MDPPRGKGVKRAFVRAGRNFGKSSFACYLAYSKALLNPDSRCYILTPLLKQVKEIYWTPQIIQRFCDVDGEPCPFISKIDNQDNRIEFFNGSFIKVDGSDQFESHRGWKPDLVIADEFAQFDPLWLEVMTPNLAARNASFIIIGTPPRNPILPNGKKHQYVLLDERFQQEAKEGKAFWFHGRTADFNPIFQTPEGKQILEDERQRLIAEGQEAVFHREWEAEIVQGGEAAVFPQFSSSIHCIDATELNEKLSKDPERYEWYCIADPGTKSVFAVLFMALDRYSGTPYFVDEIYASGAQEATVDQVVEGIKKRTGLFPAPRWMYISDSAASWFIQEAATRHGLYFAPTEKRVGDKEDGISLLRDLFRQRTHFISSKCPSFSTELINYSYDKHGNIPKFGDHLIDAARYGLKFAGFFLTQEQEPEKTEVFERPKRPGWGYSFEPFDDNTLESMTDKFFNF